MGVVECVGLDGIMHSNYSLDSCVVMKETIA